jgi:hypothetical protein
MANGLTHAIACGAATDLRTFLWQAANSYGMPAQPVPLEGMYEQPAQLLDAIKEAEDQIATIQTWSTEEAERQAEQHYREQLRHYHTHNQKQQALKNRYERMKSLVEAWEAPSPEHENFKSYMLKNIQESLDHDVRPFNAPRHLNGEDYVREEIELYRHIVETSKENLAKHREDHGQAVATAQYWVDLHASLSALTD